MLSLDNAFDGDEVIKFLVKTEKLFQKNKTDSSSAPLQYILEPKIDGLSLSLHYVDGILVKAGTRGDGLMGEDVTSNVKQFIPSIPQNILTSEKYLEVRGEVFISRGDFITLNHSRVANGESEFSTARNAAAGSLRKVLGNSKSEAVSAERKLKFFAYGLFANNSKIEEDIKAEHLADTQSELLERLSSLGFQVARPSKVCSTVEIVETCLSFEQQAGEWDYDADGAVLKVNDLAQQQVLGDGTKAPRWAIAYKFGGDCVQTTIEDIVVQVGRTGLLTPVAVLSPVMIGGVRVERATLHNANEVRRLGLFKGARVVVKRAGDVIPKVMGLVGSGEGGDSAASALCFELPSNCPVCGSPAVTDGNGTVRCSGGVTCGAQAVEQIRHFCSRDAADIDGVSGKKLEFLFNNGYIHNILDLYTLRDRAISSGRSRSSSSSSSNDKTGSTSSLRGEKGWGDKSVNNMLAAIDRSKDTLNMSRLLYGLGIPQIGLQTAKDVSAQFGDNFADFWSNLKSSVDVITQQDVIVGSDTSGSLPARLSAISGFGPVALDSLLTFARDERNAAVVDGLIRRVVPTTATETEPVPAKPVNASSTPGATADIDLPVVRTPTAKRPSDAPVTTYTPISSSQPLAGRHVVFTGAMDCMLRATAFELVTAMGGVVDNSIKSSTNLLVSCQPEGDKLSVKAQKAQDKGVEVWGESQW
eukprot:gene28276-35112_t